MQAAKLQTNHLTAPIGMGTGPLFLSWQCTDGMHRQNGVFFVWLFFLWPAFVFAPLCGHQFRCFMSNHPFVLLFLQNYIFINLYLILYYIQKKQRFFPSATEVSSGDNGGSFIEWRRFFLLAAEVVSSILHGKNLCYTMKKSLLPCCVNGHKEQAGNL